MQEAGKHFEGGGFARAVGTEEADDFARADAEVDLLDGVDVLVLATDEAADGGLEATFAFGDLVGFAERVDDDGIGGGRGSH